MAKAGLVQPAPEPSAEQIRNDAEILIETGNPRASLRPYLDDPAGAVGSLADVLAEFWRRALEPDWPRVRSLLEADLLYRSRRLTESGIAMLFSDLDPRVAWANDGVEITMHQRSEHVELAGRGLVLVPSAFSCDKPSTMTEAPWQPTVVYPARGVGLLWESAPAPPDALSRCSAAAAPHCSGTSTRPARRPISLRASA